MQASSILAYIGLTCSSILIILWLTMAIVDIKSISRVTIRLVFGIAIADFLTHISGILTIGTKSLLGTPYCETLAAIATLDRHLYAFTNIAISYHLYQVIVKLRKPSFKAELTVWVVLVLAIGVLMIIYYFVGAFSGKENKNACNPGADNPAITKAVFGLIGVFNFISIASGIYVTIKGQKCLNLWIETFTNKEILDPKDQEEFKANKLKEAKRSFLYPLSSCLTLTIEVILCFWMLVATPPASIFFANGIMLGFKGILTLTTFLIDPSTQSSLKYTFLRLKNKNNSNYEMKDIE